MPDEAPRRRTQVERSAATIDKLLTATIAAIVDIGYAGTTTREICRRARVSQGGLFRHFPTRQDVIVAAVRWLHDGMVAAIRATDAADDVLAPLRALRAESHEPSATVWLEAVMAARTDAELRRALRPLLDDQREALREAADHHTSFARLSPESKQVWLDIAEAVFTADVMWRDTIPRPDLEEPKFDALVALLDVLD